MLAGHDRKMMYRAARFLAMSVGGFISPLEALFHSPSTPFLVAFTGRRHLARAERFNGILAHLLSAGYVQEVEAGCPVAHRLSSDGDCGIAPPAGWTFVCWLAGPVSALIAVHARAVAR